MARSNRNIVLQGFTGIIGDLLILKQYKGRTVISKRPDMSNIVKSEARLKYEALFRKAVAYAKVIVNDPVKKKEYQKTLRKGKSVYHSAIKEFMKKEER